MLTTVCIADLVRLIRIQPDLVLAALQHRCCQPLLQTQGTSVTGQNRTVRSG
jgi:hypothetical protein